MPEIATLSGCLARGSVSGRFIADREAALSLQALRDKHDGSAAARFSGLSVLLALPGQLATARALMALDGTARRIVIWPENTVPERIDAIRHGAAVDEVLTQWPPPDAGDRGPAPAACCESEWVLFTSGTTGQPKMVLHTLRTLAGHLLEAPPASGPVWCTFYDIRRYGGMQILLRALIGGGSLVLSDPTELPGAFLQRAARHGATHFLGTPSHWRRALMTEASGTIAPDYVRLSGEVADQAILDRLSEAYPRARLVHAFASTEAGLACEVSDGLAGLPAESVGCQNGFAEVEVRDGMLRARSARNALGYLDRTVQRLKGDGGFVETGDVLEQRGDRWYFAGRRDGVINVGGAKIHPEEVEAVLHLHPAVAMCSVRARANPLTGAIVVAEVVARGPGEGDLAAGLRAFCRERLEPHKVPATIRIVSGLELGASGKLARAVA